MIYRSKDFDGDTWIVSSDGNVCCWVGDEDYPGQAFWSNGDSPGMIIWNLVRLDWPLPIIKWVQQQLWEFDLSIF